MILPDGSCSSITLRPGASIREVLQDLCHNISVNIAAVDLFLVGGDKVRKADSDKCWKHLLLIVLNIAASSSSMKWLSSVFNIRHTKYSVTTLTIKTALFFYGVMVRTFYPLNWVNRISCYVLYYVLMCVFFFSQSRWCWIRTAWLSAHETWGWKNGHCLGVNSQSDLQWTINVSFFVFKAAMFTFAWFLILDWTWYLLTVQWGWKPNLPNPSPRCCAPSWPNTVSTSVILWPK